MAQELLQRAHGAGAAQWRPWVEALPARVPLPWLHYSAEEVAALQVRGGGLPKFATHILLAPAEPRMWQAGALQRWLYCTGQYRLSHFKTVCPPGLLAGLQDQDVLLECRQLREIYDAACQVGTRRRALPLGAGCKCVAAMASMHLISVSQAHVEELVASGRGCLVCPIVPNPLCASCAGQPRCQPRAAGLGARGGA